MRVTTNPNQEITKKILAALEENKKKYGKRYCPCVLPSNHNDDTVCMCKEFREQLERGDSGECHCGLYVVTND